MCAKRGSTIYRVKATERDISYGPAKWRLTLSLFPSPVCFSLLLFPPRAARDTGETKATKEARGRDERRKKRPRGERQVARTSSCIKCVYRLRPGKKAEIPKGALKRSGKKITLCTPYVIRARPVFDEHACAPRLFTTVVTFATVFLTRLSTNTHIHRHIASLAFGYFVGVLLNESWKSINSSLKNDLHRMTCDR